MSDFASEMEHVECKLLRAIKLIFEVIGERACSCKVRRPESPAKLTLLNGGLSKVGVAKGAAGGVVGESNLVVVTKPIDE